MDFDFEESLPSNSNLIAPVRNGSSLYGSNERQSYDYSQYMDDSRSASPPPPPPPAHLPTTDHGVTRALSEPRKQESSGSSKSKGKDRPSFPFLKKGSRKEPSALNRSPSSKSPPPTSGTSPNTASSRFDDRETSPDVYDSSPNQCHDSNDEGSDPNEESGEILLTGKEYWQTDDMNSHSTAPQSTRFGAPLGSTMRVTGHLSAGTDYLDNSTINIGGDQWQQQRDAGQSELDEFELIEQQLANNAISNTFGAVNKSLSSSTNFASSLVGHSANVRPTARRLGTDWSDAYDHDSFAKTKNVQREGTQPDRSSFANTSYPRGPQQEGDSGGEEEQYAEDFSDEDEGQEHQEYDAHSSSVAKRPSVSTYLATVSPQHVEDQEYRGSRQSTSLNEYESGAQASRPSYSKYWEEPSTSPQTEEAPHVHSDVCLGPVRTNESPSWGRSTQPVGSSFESDGASELDDPGGVSDLSRTAEASKVARMSDSALRKISSRTAALHGQVPPSRADRHTLADDTNSAHENKSDVEDSSGKGVQYTRPTPVRRGLASTHSGPTASTGAKPRSSSTGGRLRPGAVGGVDASPATLAGKAQELEKELETYRSENANLKKLRRQQEASLAEVVHQKEDLVRWVAEERTKTLKWCEEQTQAATKERNAAAKMARDSRQKALTGAVPIRKEKAEIEGLQATIEKMKIDHESAAKKWKLAEARLYSLIKDHAAHIESTEKQLLAVEQEKLLLLEYIGEQGLRLPKELRNSLQRTPLYRTSPDASAKLSTSSAIAQDVLRGKSPGHSRSKYQRTQGYAEEVDVEFAESTTSTFHSTPRASSGTGRSATPTARSAPKLASTHQPGEMLNRQSSNIRSGLSATGARPAARVADMVGANMSSSWARSSRSSHGSASRYDHADDEAVSDVPFVARSGSEDVLQQSTAKVSAVIKASSPRGPPDLPSGHAAARSPVHSSASMFKSNLSASAALPVGTVNLSAPTQSNGAATGRIEETLPDGKKLIKYKNGTQKEVDESGNSLVRFLNGDTKSVNVVSGVVIYYYAQADTTHTTFKDGLEVYEFPNKQVEMHFPDGVKEIIFPDSTRKIINPNGLQESHFPDGVILREHADGRREVLSGAKDT